MQLIDKSVPPSKQINWINFDNIIPQTFLYVSTLIIDINNVLN